MTMRLEETDESCLLGSPTRVTRTGSARKGAKHLSKRIAAAILMCAIMVLVAAAPLAIAGTHEIIKGDQGPRANAVTWEYVPTSYGFWMGHIINNGLRSLTVDVYDVTTGVPEEIMHQRIRFATYDAYPTGIVDTRRVVVASGHVYSITVTPSGPKGSYCTVDDSAMPPPPNLIAIITILSVENLTMVVDAAMSYDPDGMIVSYGWDFGDGTTATGLTTTHTYFMEGTYEITLTVMDNYGFTSTDIEPVTVVYHQQWASFTCVVDGLTVYVDASSSMSENGIVSYDWKWGDGTTGTGVTASHAYSTVKSVPMGSESTRLERGRPPPPHPVFGYTYGPDGVTLLYGCNVTITNLRTGESFVAETYPEYAAYSSDMSMFRLGYVIGDILNVTATKDAYFGWAEGPVTSNDYDQIDVMLHFRPRPMEVTITLTVTDTTGQTDSANKTVMLMGPEPPVATFSFVVDHLSVTVDGGGSFDPDGLIVSYDWTFGDGGTAYGVTADHTYALPGPYKVILTLTDDDGLVDSSTTFLNIVDGLPIASFTYTTSGLVIDVDASGSSDDYGIVSYNWDWGDGTTGTGVTASHTYATVNSSPIGTGSATLGRDVPAHYLVMGHTYGPDGASPMNGCRVVVTNLRTGESLYPPHWQLPDQNVWAADLADLTLGFAFGDILNVTATKGTYVGWADSPIIDNGGTEYLVIDVALHSIPTMRAIALTVTDTIGQTCRVVKYVFVPTPSPPVASFHHNAYGLPVDVDASGSSGDGVIVSYVWDWGDGTTGYGMIASHTYAASVNSTPSEPYTGPPDGLHMIFGFTYAADGVTVMPGCDVTLVNLRTGYSLTTTSDADYGFYSVDPTWFELGWVVGDLIRVTATSGEQTGWTVSPLTDNLNGYNQIDVAMGSGFVTITLKVTDTLGQTASASQQVELYL